MIKSPCIRNCCLDEDDICMGCFRHVDEIIKWQDINDEEKNKVLMQANNRRHKKQSKNTF